MDIINGKLVKDCRRVTSPLLLNLSSNMSDFDDVRYELVAFIRHIGVSGSNGHYVTFQKISNE